MNKTLLKKNKRKEKAETFYLDSSFQRALLICKDPKAVSGV